MSEENTVIANGDDDKVYILDIATGTFTAKIVEDANDSSDEQESNVGTGASTGQTADSSDEASA